MMRWTCALACVLVPLVMATSAPQRGRALFALPVQPFEDAYLMPKPTLVPPCRANHTRHENLCVRRLSGRVQRLELALAAVCSAVLYADDVAWSERAVAAAGDVYLDASLLSSRQPRLLRRSLLRAMTQHGIVETPPETHWQYRDILDEFREQRQAEDE